MGTIPQKIRDWLLPTFCVGCGQIGTHICSVCLIKKTESARSRCAVCGKSSLYGFTHPDCSARGHIDGVFSLYRYDGLIRKLIRLIKYSGAHRIVDDIEASLHPEVVRTVQNVFAMWSPDLLIPVPLHPKKEHLRGFNQAERIAQLVSGLCVEPIPIDGHTIYRTRQTPPQSSFSTHAARASNILDAFHYAPKGAIEGVLRGKTVVVVDDIWTSGATGKEMAKTLKYNGVKSIYIFTIAHG